ncbi:SIR2 family protein [Heyndrickxia coagulans]|uniref:SIR2 family protein n=1 Tax=Heyndrickxia coagulans TaxID=1398 RepID=UPI0028FBF113|nr:SIR2 family protein [Heyndrickxia coagulans]MDT9757006.1 SIR2 family protein [Heyndrickxia coagulans]
MKKVVLTGNGLSVGLNRAFALQNITQTFYSKLTPEHQKFIQHHMERIQKDEYIQVDFEEAIASIEQVHDALDSYVNFLINEEEGKKYLESEGLDVEELQSHLTKIKEIIISYTSSIVEIIDGNVHWEQIGDRLSGFINWLQAELQGNDEIDLFTLNFDLLLETILLRTVGTDEFTDFHVKRGKTPDGHDKFNFDPQQTLNDFDYRRIRLHHLHGSLSSFKRLSDGRIFKLRTEDIRLSDLYKKLDANELFPSIITGGFKSKKIQILPFSFYYGKFKEKMVDPENLCEELYIIGYSFRDEHINKAISERLKIHRKRDGIPLKRFVIVDYKLTEEEQDRFIEDVNKALELGRKTKLKKEDGIFIFNGADAIDGILHASN